MREGVVLVFQTHIKKRHKRRLIVLLVFLSNPWKKLVFCPLCFWSYLSSFWLIDWLISFMSYQQYSLSHLIAKSSYWNICIIVHVNINSWSNDFSIILISCLLSSNCLISITLRSHKLLVSNMHASANIISGVFLLWKMNYLMFCKCTLP